MNYLKTDIINTILPTALLAVGRDGRGLLIGHEPRAPDCHLKKDWCLIKDGFLNKGIILIEQTSA